MSDVPEKGDAWRFTLVSVKFGADAVPEGIDPPKLAEDRELAAARVLFTYVGTSRNASVPRKDFSMFGPIQQDDGTWSAEVYFFNLVGSFPDKDWRSIPRDEQRGYALFFVVPRDVPDGVVMWAPGGVETIYWNFARE